MPTLKWLTRDDDLKSAAKAAYRLLREVPELGAGDKNTGNMIIQGDNLEALKALLPFYAGQVKCIYIDPPYNTGSAFEQYDDNLEHTMWLSIIYPRLELLRDLLIEDGSIWINIDDDEQAYLKVICDEVFGRTNYVANCIWQKRTSPDMRVLLGDAHEYILVYAKDKATFMPTINQLQLDEKQRLQYKNPDNDPRGSWASSDFTAQGYRPNQMYKIITPGGKEYIPPEGRCWKNIESVYKEQSAAGMFWYGKDGRGIPRRKTYLNERTGVNAWTWWPNNEVGHSQEAKKESNFLFGTSFAFATPKPERLIQRVLTLATNPGDLVLDSFIGSGTTAAVAHKMGRRYIGIEIGEHAKTHCAARLRKVIDGEQGGISEAVGWKGGGGFRFYDLGDTIFDEDGKIRETITFDQLAAHIWFYETKTPYNIPETKSAALGVHNGVAYALLYNGILHDKRVDGGNVLTILTLDTIRKNFGDAEYEKLVIYGEASLFDSAGLKDLNIQFRQTPYDVRVK